MTTRFRLWFSLCFLAFATVCASSQVQTLALDQGWEFRQAASAVPATAQPRVGDVSPSRWRPAAVPGDIHLDLLAQKLIPDPFFGTNEAKLQWISAADWEYRTIFDPSPSFRSQRHVEAVFEGLDSYALVYLNGEGSRSVQIDRACKISHALT